MKRLLIIFCCIYFLPGKIMAQPADAAFKNLTSANGLPTTSVTDVAQDSYGFIWIGSWYGTYRYDGSSFKKMAVAGKNIYGGRYLAADKKGGMWISFGTNVGYYDPTADSIRMYEIPRALRYGPLRVDNSGNVWVGTIDGLVKFDSVTHLFKKDNGQRTGEVYRLAAAGHGQLLFNYYDDKNKQVLIGKRNSKGEYTYEPYPVDMNRPGKSKLFDDSTWTVLRPIDSTGMLLVNEYGWAYKNLHDTNWVFKKLTNNEKISRAEDVELDPHGNFWLSQVDTLSKINITSGKRTIYKHDPSNPNSLLSLNHIFAGSNMFFDKQGVLWICSFSQGISRLNLFESDFGLLKDSTGSPVMDVISTLESKDGSYWIGSRNQVNNGLIHYSADGKIIKTYGSKSFDSPPGRTVSDQLSHPFAWALAESKDGSIWVGTGSPGPNRGGLNRIRPGSNEITRFKYDPSDSNSLPDNWIHYLLVDGSDRVWVGTSKGLCYIDPATEKITRGIRSPGSDSADMTPYYLGLVTSSGNLVIANDEYKSYIIDHKTLEKKPFGVATDSLEQLYYVRQDDAGKIWFISNKGFGYLDSSYKKVAYYYDFKNKDFPADEIYGLAPDKEGKIWLATDNGIIQFDPATEKARHFGFDRGLQGNLFMQTRNNCKGPSGKIYFAGNGGINIFKPGDIKTNLYPPEMVFTDLKLDGQSIHFGKDAAIQNPIFAADKITVGPDVLTISIDFAAIHFAGENSNQYQYKLKGFDKDWRDGGTIGNATYTNLSPGKYTLYIKGSNWDDVWSDGKKSIQIIVLPPWWRTWWAYALYGLLFLFVLWQFFRYQKIRTIRKEREKTQQRELEQAKEIEKAYTELKATQSQLIQSEKMASLGELTAGIAHEIQNPLNFVNNFSEVNKEMIAEMKEEIAKGNYDEVKIIANDIEANEEKINHHGKRADAIVKGMLQHSRVSTGVKEPTDINALCDEYLRLSYHGLRAKDKDFNAEIKTDFDESIGKINVVPQDIGRVLLNLYNNAFYAVNERLRQAQPDNHYEPTVSVTTKKSKNSVLITVSDNGNGIPEKIKEKIFQPFFTTKPTGSGTGLGLSLAYDIVKAHGGEIKVESEENEGTEFIITIPEG